MSTPKREYNGWAIFIIAIILAIPIILVLVVAGSVVSVLTTVTSTKALAKSLAEAGPVAEIRFTKPYPARAIEHELIITKLNVYDSDKELIPLDDYKSVSIVDANETTYDLSRIVNDENGFIIQANRPADPQVISIKFKNPIEISGISVSVLSMANLVGVTLNLIDKDGNIVFEEQISSDAEQISF